MQFYDAPNLEFLCNMTLDVEVDFPVLNKTYNGSGRRIIGVTGGKLTGPEFEAKVLPGGSDWITVREDGTIIQDVKIVLETDDHETILMIYRGIRTGPKEILEKLNRGEKVPADQYYFRHAPIFETDSPKYDWMNKHIFVATGERLPSGVQYSLFTVK